LQLNRAHLHNFNNCRKTSHKIIDSYYLTAKL